MTSGTPEKALGNVVWPSATGLTFQWDAGSGVCRDVELLQVLEGGRLPSFQVEGVPHTEPRAQSCWPGKGPCLNPVFVSQSLASTKASTGMLFSITTILPGNNSHQALSSTTGELLWFFSHKQPNLSAASVYPVLFGYAGDKSPQRECITIVPVLPACDPLQHHIDLVLHTAVAAKSRAEQIYVGALVDALAMHFLRRYAASQPVVQKLPGGLLPHKLRRTLAYIQTHLTQKLSLSTLAAVAQMSPTHFAHLFKHATGVAPHRYVILCRIEHAKRLLNQTDMPLVDIGPESGFSDQSHFTALFQKHVAMTPRTYRDVMARG